MKEYDGREVGRVKGSSLFAFASSSVGVQFALHLQAEMRRAHTAEKQLLTLHCGLHKADVSFGSRPNEQSDFLDNVVTIASLLGWSAVAGQILCTRQVLEDAMAIIEPKMGMYLGWKSHGTHAFIGLEEPIEVCEVGEREFAPFVAPRVFTNYLQSICDTKPEINQYPRPKLWHCIYCGWMCDDSSDDYICKSCGQIRPFFGGSATMVKCKNCERLSLALARFCEWCGTSFGQC